MLAVAAIAVIVALDQWSKYWAIHVLKEAVVLPGVPGVFQVFYVENRGAAFSIMQNKQLTLILVTAAVLAFAGLALYKRWITHPLGKWSLFLIVGGAIGNLIDRIRLGYVVDMIDLTFMRFAVFNVADCFVTVGTILFAVYLLLYNEKTEK